MFWLGRFFVEKHKEQKLQAQKLSFVYAALSNMENCAPNKKLSKIYEAILFQLGDKTIFYQPTKPINV
uniref:Uncharacterized protein n=1 Tax=Panagrolaimus sp. PS1159 TaxID=55785 RepID=A0AC35EYP7_9BILA